MKLIKYFETHFIACVALAGLDQIPLYAYKWSITGLFCLTRSSNVEVTPVPLIVQRINYFMTHFYRPPVTLTDFHHFLACMLTYKCHGQWGCLWLSQMTRTAAKCCVCVCVKGCSHSPILSATAICRHDKHLCRPLYHASAC